MIPQQKTPEHHSMIILQAVASHEHQLGLTTLALILKGSKDKTLSARKLYDSPFYGAFFYYPLDVIQNFIRQLITKELVQQVMLSPATHFGYAIPFLSVTENGKQTLLAKTDIPLEIQRTIKPLAINPSIIESLQLLKQKKSISEIAALRNLTPDTIYGHFAIAIKLNHLMAGEIVAHEKIKLILNAKAQTNTTSLKALKEALPPEITYGEIRCVLAQEYEI